MQLSPKILAVVEGQISQAGEEKDIDLLLLQTLFVMNNFTLSLVEVFPDLLVFVKPIGKQLRTEVEFIFSKQYIKWLKNMLALNQQLYDETLDFTEIRVEFESWFIHVTHQGMLEWTYQVDSLISVTEVIETLGLSRKTLLSYLNQGLEAFDIKMPNHTLEILNNPHYYIRTLLNGSTYKSRMQPPDHRLQEIEHELHEFQQKYGNKTFEEAFAEYDGDSMDDPTDYYRWRDGIEESEEIKNMIRKKQENNKEI